MKRFNIDVFTYKVIIHFGLVCCLILFYFLLGHIKEKPITQPRKDAHGYVTAAFNLQRYKIFSKDPVESASHNPSAFVAPGYPFFLSKCISFSSELRNVNLKELYSKDVLPHFHIFITFQRIVHIMTALLILIVVRYLIGSMVAAYLSFFFVLFDLHLLGYTTNFLTEILTAFLITALSVCLYFTVKKQSIWLYGLSGLICGYLVITRGRFEYFLYILIIIFIANILKLKIRKKHGIVALIMFVFASSSIIVPWKLRNHNHFGCFIITQGGGPVLLVRANYNMMTWKEYCASFFYWSCSLNNYTDKFFKKEDYIRLIRRQENPLCIYQNVLKEYKELVDLYGIQQADVIQKNKAINMIISHPFRHLLFCIPFAWRGMNLKPIIMLQPLWFIALLYCAYRSIRNGKLENLLLYLPATFSFLFLTVFSHNLDRYNIPILPILYVAVIDCVWIVIRKIYSFEKLPIKIKYLLEKLNSSFSI